MTQTLFSVILTGFCASYSNDDDSNGDFRNDLNGNWEMTSYFSFLPTLPDIADGDIIWTIDVDNNLLFITNAIASEYPYLLVLGNYDIIIIIIGAKSFTILNCS